MIQIKETHRLSSDITEKEIHVQMLCENWVVDIIRLTEQVKAAVNFQIILQNLTSSKVSPSLIIEFSTALNRSLRLPNCEYSSSVSLMSMGCNIIDINSATRQKSLSSLRRNPR